MVGVHRMLQGYLGEPVGSGPIPLCKATGEGSRGGKILGHTRSGKPIYAKHGDRKAAAGQFSSQDHYDAYNWHSRIGDLHQAGAINALDASDSDSIEPSLRQHLMARHDRLSDLSHAHRKVGEWHFQKYKAKSAAQDKVDEKEWEQMQQSHAVRAG